MPGKSDALRERYERFSQGDLERALDLVRQSQGLPPEHHEVVP